MSTGRDDDALSWAGEDDPTLASSSTPPRDQAVTPASTRGDANVTRNTDVSDDAADAGAPALSSGALIGLGVLGGVYLLYTIGWLVGGLRVQTVAGLLVAPTVSVPALVLAVAAPAVWFFASYVLTRGRATWLRFVWLAAGAVLLVPWPFSMLGIGG